MNIVCIKKITKTCKKISGRSTVRVCIYVLISAIHSKRTLIGLLALIYSISHRLNLAISQFERNGDRNWKHKLVHISFNQFLYPISDCSTIFLLLYLEYAVTVYSNKANLLIKT